MSLAASAIEVVLPALGGERLAGLPHAERNRRVIAREGARPVEAASGGDAGQWCLVLRPGVALDRGFAAELPAVEAPVMLSAGFPVGIWGPGPAVRRIRQSGGEDAQLPVVQIDSPGFLDASDPAARREAGRELLRRTAKPSDGAVSRLLNRPVSRFFSAMFLALRLRPIHASAVSLAIGLASAWFAAIPSHLAFAIAGALFQLASMFDGVDGELARVTLRDSRAGAVIDTAIDNLTYVACLVGFLIGWYREGIGPGETALLVTLFLLLPLSLGWVALLVRRHAADGSMLHFTAWLEDACRRPGCPAGLRFARSLFPFTRRDAAALILMLVSLTGSRELLVWLVLSGLVVGDYVLLFHRHRLVAMAAPPSRSAEPMGV